MSFKNMWMMFSRPIEKSKIKCKSCLFSIIPSLTMNIL